MSTSTIDNATIYPNPTEEQKQEIITKLALKPFTNKNDSKVNRITIKKQNSESFEFLDNPEIYFSSKTNNFVIFGKFQDSQAEPVVKEAENIKPTVQKTPNAIHDDLAVQADAPKISREELLQSYENKDNVVVDEAFLKEFGNGITEQQINVVSRQTGSQDKYMIYKVLTEKKQDLISAIITVKDLIS
ncbi:hypothetical protein QEN19_002592 [Hanseniaspora menglaensis]